MKKTYISPMVEVEEYEDLCQTGMNSASFSTKTDRAADDQYDVTPEGPEIGPSDPTDTPQPPVTWDW